MIRDIFSRSAWHVVWSDPQTLLLYLHRLLIDRLPSTFRCKRDSSFLDKGQVTSRYKNDSFVLKKKFGENDFSVPDHDIVHRERACDK